MTVAGHAGADGRRVRRPADGRFEVLASERVYDGRIARVRVDQIVMPGGSSASREVVEHLDAVAVAAVDDQDRIVMIEQYRHPLRRRLWELPAGLLDVAGEDPRAAAARELAEEAGLAADRWQTLVDLATSPGYSTEALRVYLGRGLTPVDAPERAEEEADLAVVRVPLAAAVDAVFAGTIVNASAVAGVLAAAHILGATGDRPLRPADAPWSGGPASVHAGPHITDAPPL